MIDVDKLNNSISDLEKQSAKLKSIMEVYDKVNKLTDRVTESNDLQKIGIKEITTIGDELGTTAEKANNQALELIAIGNKITKDFKVFENDFLRDVQKIQSENTKLHIEIQDILTSKLDRYKSDIEVEIRRNVADAKTEITRELSKGLEELSSKLLKETSAISSAQKEYMGMVNKKFKTVYFIGGIAIVLILVNIVLRFVSI